mmetsp:Transcript_7167/g.6358  ORF Transcript_7167/g.6358 Transcript_7167/m.6358 type:complete len:89 (+) Transcript_7167:647-913(+)
MISKPIRTKIAKTITKKETKSGSIKSTKRVLVKKIDQKPKGRILRSGTTLGKNLKDLKVKKVSPRTRSQKKRNKKKESSTSKLVKSIK